MIYVMLVALPLLINQENHTLRIRYEKAYQSKAETKQLVRDLERKNDRSATETAYLGAATLLMAHHDFDPFAKLGYFQRGKKMIEQAVEMDPKSAEIRYLRFVNQAETPRILGYKDNLHEDLELIAAAFHQMDVDLKKRVSAFMMSCKYLEEEQRRNFEIR